MEKGAVVRWVLFWYRKLVKGMHSMEVRSRKVHMGRVLRRTSRKHRLMAFASRTGFRSSGVSYRKGRRDRRGCRAGI